MNEQPCVTMQEAADMLLVMSSAFKTAEEAGAALAKKLKELTYNTRNRSGEMSENSNISLITVPTIDGGGELTMINWHVRGAMRIEFSETTSTGRKETNFQLSVASMRELYGFIGAYLKEME